MDFVAANLLGIAAGIVIKILVPMPFLDDPVRQAWSWAWKNSIGRL